MAKVAPGAESGETTDTPLLTLEGKGMFLMAPGITTVQFYEGDSAAAAVYLRERLGQVVALSPWIAGRLVHKKKVHGALAHIRHARSDTEIPAAAVDALFAVDESLTITADMSYTAMTKAVNKSAAHIKRASSKLLNKDAPFARLTVAPASGGPNGFCVIFSMSHVVVDGASYYATLNMLSDGAELKPINAVRKQALADQVESYVGKKEHAAAMGGAGIWNGIGCMIRGPKARMHCYLLDEDKVAAAKAAAVATDDAAARGVKFVSTNDVITSGLGCMVKARLLTMAINFRGKIPGITFDDAGNYHHGLIYDAKGFGSAAAIRQSLAGPAPMSRASPWPSALTRSRCRMAMITSWASMARGSLDVPNCAQTMHLPVVNPAEAIMDMAVVFKARPGKVGMLLFLKRTGKADIAKHLPVGEELAPAMFGAKQ